MDQPPLSSRECRLCLNPAEDIACSIDSPNLQEQIAQVFRFPIDPKEGYPANVCQICFRTIDELYRFVQKVQQNQDQLDSIRLASDEQWKTVKVEVQLLGDSVQKDSVEPADPVVDDCCSTTSDVKEEVDYLDDDDYVEKETFAEPYEPPIRKPRKKRLVKRKKQSSMVELKEDHKSKIPKRMFKTKEQLEKEDEMIREFFRLACDICEEEVSNFPALEKHFRQKHNRSGYVVCCKKRFSRRCFLLQHIALHSNPGLNRCDICNKDFQTKRYLNIHKIQVHGSEDDRPFKCSQCSQSFTKTYLLRAHMDVHQSIQCTICNKSFPGKQALSSHMYHRHSDKDRRMICDHCGQEFVTKDCFRRHVKEHLEGLEGIRKPMLQCDQCQKWFTTKRGLYNHVKFVHSDQDQTVVCDICQQQYPHTRALENHKRSVHIAQRFECEFCGKAFKRAINLKEHRTIHTGERLYCCEICSVTMNSKANLYSHVKKAHPEEYAQKKLKETVGRNEAPV